MNAKIIPITVLLCFLNACSVLQGQGSRLSGESGEESVSNVKNGSITNTSDLAWWSVKFSRPWSEDILWHVDALIGHVIIKPVLDAAGDKIKLWRFHRRSVNDNDGHRFTFYFYSTAAEAQRVYRGIAEHSITQALIDTPLSYSLVYQELSANDRQSIEDISDKEWSPEIQRAWPYFAMGVSQTWLALINDLVTKSSESANIKYSLDEKLRVYKEVHEKIDKMWEAQGNHAFLHHLNALFGYKELYIYERQLRRF